MIPQIIIANNLYAEAHGLRNLLDEALTYRPKGYVFLEAAGLILIEDIAVGAPQIQVVKATASKRHRLTKIEFPGFASAPAVAVVNLKYTPIPLVAPDTMPTEQHDGLLSQPAVACNHVSRRLFTTTAVRLPIASGGTKFLQRLGRLKSNPTDTSDSSRWLLTAAGIVCLMMTRATTVFARSALRLEFTPTP